MDIYRKIRVGCNFATLKNFMTCKRKVIFYGIFCRVVILVVFKVFLVVKNLEILIQIVPERSIYSYYHLLILILILEACSKVGFLKPGQMPS